jgi:hypothetical protein
MVVGPDGGARLRGTVDAVEGGLSVSVAGEWRRPVRVPVRPGGVFEVEIPRATRPFTITVTSGRSVLLRSAPVPPRPRR